MLNTIKQLGCLFYNYILQTSALKNQNILSLIANALTTISLILSFQRVRNNKFVFKFIFTNLRLLWLYLYMVFARHTSRRGFSIPLGSQVIISSQLLLFKSFYPLYFLRKPAQYICANIFPHLGFFILPKRKMIKSMSTH